MIDCPSIIVSPYQFLQRATSRTRVTHAVSILGEGDRLDWPNFGPVATLRLRFDDIHAPARGWVPPQPEHITELIEFGRLWAGSGPILIHCRAGSSRSPAAAIIVAAVLGSPASDDLVRRLRLRRHTTARTGACWLLPIACSTDDHC